MQIDAARARRQHG